MVNALFCFYYFYLKQLLYYFNPAFGWNSIPFFFCSLISPVPFASCIYFLFFHYLVFSIYYQILIIHTHNIFIDSSYIFLCYFYIFSFCFSGYKIRRMIRKWNNNKNNEHKRRRRGKYYKETHETWCTMYH